MVGHLIRLSLPTVDYYFRPPRPQKPDPGLETDEEKEGLSEWTQAAPSPPCRPDPHPTCPLKPPLAWG